MDKLAVERAKSNLRAMADTIARFRTAGPHMVQSGHFTRETIARKYVAMADLLAIGKAFYLEQGLLSEELDPVTDIVTMDHIMASIDDAYLDPNFDIFRPQDFLE